MIFWGLVFGSIEDFGEFDEEDDFDWDEEDE